MKFLLHGWLLPIGTGALLALAYPPFNLGQLGWLALVPLLFAIEDCGAGEAFRRGYIAGLVFFGATTWWIVHVSLPGAVALISFLALYFGAGACWFAKLFSTLIRDNREPVWRNLVTMVFGSAGWITLEWLRGWFMFGGFGWIGMKSIGQGAATQCYVAVHPNAQGINGRYWSDCNVSQSATLGQNDALAERLWRESERIAATVSS